jgi:hypothetical protein
MTSSPETTDWQPPREGEPVFIHPRQTEALQRAFKPHYEVVINALLNGRLDEDDVRKAAAASQRFGATVKISDAYKEGPVQLRAQGQTESCFVMITGEGFQAGYFDATTNEPLRQVKPELVFIYDTFIARPKPNSKDDDQQSDSTRAYGLEIEAHALMHLAGNARVTRRALFDYGAYEHVMAVNEVNNTDIVLTYEPLDAPNFY